MQNTPYIPIGQASAATDLAFHLGQRHEDSQGRVYVLCKAAAAIATCASKVLVTAVSSGVPTFNVNTTTTAANGLVIGVVPAGQTGSDGSTGLVSGDYFWVQVGGYSKVITITGSTAIGTGLVTTTTAGKADPIDATFAATDPGSVFATLLEASNADAASDILLVRRF